MAVFDMRLEGTAELLASLRNISDKVSSTARKTMHRGADRIVKRAKLYAPVDTGALVDSIHKEVGYDDQNRRLEIDIVAGGEVDGVDVDAYVLEIHENYESMKPGKNTLAKMAANPGVLIGSKFLERAVDEEREKLEREVIVASVAVGEGEIR